MRQPRSFCKFSESALLVAMTFTGSPLTSRRRCSTVKSSGIKYKRPAEVSAGRCIRDVLVLQTLLATECGGRLFVLLGLSLRGLRSGLRFGFWLRLGLRFSWFIRLGGSFLLRCDFRFWLLCFCWRVTRLIFRLRTW